MSPNNKKNCLTVAEFYMLPINFLDHSYFYKKKLFKKTVQEGYLNPSNA